MVLNRSSRIAAAFRRDYAGNFGLAGERDAYVISEVLAHATREATMERRHSYAALIRSRLRRPGIAFEAPGSRRPQRIPHAATCESYLSLRGAVQDRA